MGYDTGAFDIKYMPRTSVKGQVLVDLVAEFAKPSLEEETWVKNQLARSPCKSPHVGKYMLIAQQTKEAPEWG